MRAVRSLVTDASERSDEWLKMSVPALLYTVQNNCLYIGFHHLEAAVGQVTYQSKIFFTAFFSVVLLGKKLHAPQWAALVLLAAGVVCVQGLDRLLKSAESTTPHKTGRHHHPRPDHTAGAKARPGPGRGLAELDFVPSTMIGLVAFLVASLCTSFASVYFEKMLKSASKPSLWLRNIQLAVYSSIIASAYLASQDDAAIREGGWFHGFNIGTWLSITWQAGGGILVAVTIKYADNILRGFAQALAIIVASFLSVFVNNFVITPSFVLGVVLVILAVFLYGDACCFPSCEGGQKIAPDDASKPMLKGGDGGDAASSTAGSTPEE